MTIEEKVAKLNETYAAVDRELALYSQKANSSDLLVRATANAHYAEAERLQTEARALVRS